MRQETDDASHHVLAPSEPPLPSRVEGAVVAPVVVSLREEVRAARWLKVVVVVGWKEEIEKGEGRGREREN